MCHLTCIIRPFRGYEMGHFRKAVHHYKQGIMASLGLWQSQDKIHGNISPWFLWHRSRHIEACILLPPFSIWHTLQTVTSLFMSLLILGQKNFSFTNPKVLSLPKWPPKPFKCISLTRFYCLDPRGIQSWEPLNKKFKVRSRLTNLLCSICPHLHHTSILFTSPLVKSSMMFLSSIWHKW